MQSMSITCHSDLVMITDSVHLINAYIIIIIIIIIIIGLYSNAASLCYRLHSTKRFIFVLKSLLPINILITSDPITLQSRHHSQLPLHDSFPVWSGSVPDQCLVARRQGPIVSMIDHVAGRLIAVGPGLSAAVQASSVGRPPARRKWNPHPERK